MAEQVLIVNNRGETLYTFGKLMPKHWLLHRSVREDFPILDSIWEQLPSLPVPSFPLVFRFVESPHRRLEGFYHLRLSGKENHWRISLCNCTLEAQQYRHYLQRRNEMLLRDQRFTTRGLRL